MVSEKHPLAGKKNLRYRDVSSENFVYPHKNCCFTKEVMNRIEESSGKRVPLSCLGSVAFAVTQVMEEKAILVATLRAARFLESQNRMVCLDMAEETLHVWQRLLYREQEEGSPSVKSITSLCQERFLNRDWEGENMRK